MKVLFICAIGVTSTIFKDKLTKVINSNQIEINSMDVNLAKNVYCQFDYIIVLPQISFMFEQIKHTCDELKVDCVLLTTSEYNDCNLSRIQDLIMTKFNLLKRKNIYMVYDSNCGGLFDMYLHKLQNKSNLDISKLSFDEVNNVNDNAILIMEPKLLFKSNMNINNNIQIIHIMMADFATLNVDPVLNLIS